MGLLLPRIFYDCLQLPFGLSTAHLCPCKILFHLTALPIPTLKAFSFKLAVLFFFFFLSIKILTFKEDTLVLTGQISPAFTLALVPDSIPLKTCSSLAWPPSTRTSPQAAHLPCRLTAVRSPSCWGASLAACACRPGNSILLGVSSLLVRTPNTFLGNLPRFCQWRCSRNKIERIFSSAAHFISRFGYFCSQFYSSPVPQTGNYPAISFSPLPSLLQKQSFCIILLPNPSDAFFILYL